MMKQPNSPVPTNYFLQPGFIYVATRPAVISTVVGSCVAICIYDRKKKIGGMNHFQLPFILEKKRATARYGNVAVSALINMMIHEGSKPKDLETQIIGGAFNPRISQKNIGQENVRVARRIILQKMVRVVSEDVGGVKGRKIVFNTSSNEVAVVKVEKLRQCDWFPYNNDR